MFINDISQEVFKPLEDKQGTPNSVCHRGVQIKYQEMELTDLGEVHLSLEKREIPMGPW